MNWERTIDVSEPFAREDMQGIVDILEVSSIPTDILNELEEYAKLDMMDAFNETWDALYDWADEERVWIQTWKRGKLGEK